MTAPPRAAVVLPAGGTGQRMGAGGVRKQYVELAGTPILLRSLNVFLEHPAFELVVVALPADDAANPPAFLPEQVTVVAGGETRGESVLHGLAVIPDRVDVVLIHDAARPLVTASVVARVLEAAASGVGAVAALPVQDTLKRVTGDRVVTSTLDRAGVWAVQTPQGFPRQVISEAYRSATELDLTATDDAGLVERVGVRVVVVRGDVHNIKITTPGDLALAETIIAARSSR